jgi:DNA-directed RNA polymerase subunit RPC12/RpoP
MADDFERLLTRVLVEAANSSPLAWPPVEWQGLAVFVAKRLREIGDEEWRCENPSHIDQTLPLPCSQCRKALVLPLEQSVGVCPNCGGRIAAHSRAERKACHDALSGYTREHA